MGVKIDVVVPEWLTSALAGDPETDLRVAFASQPELFSRVVTVGEGGVEYDCDGRLCAQPVEDAVAYRIGPDGEPIGVRGVAVEIVAEEIVEVEAVTVDEDEPKAKSKSTKAAKNKK